jgi:hypothetical protein
MPPSAIEITSPVLMSSTRTSSADVVIYVPERMQKTVGFVNPMLELLEGCQN